MERFSKDDTEYALACLKQLMESMGLNETQFGQLSGVSQSTISKILNRKQEATPEAFRKLSKGLGHDVNDFICALNSPAPDLTGHLATPLTGLSDSQDRL